MQTAIVGKILVVACCLVLSFSFVGPSNVSAGNNWMDWKPIRPEELQGKTPLVDKDADAEALFWEIRVEDIDGPNIYSTQLNHYIRIKIFTDRGKEKQSTVDIVYSSGTEITGIVGRTILPTGSIIELKKDAVFDRTLIKENDSKVKAKSFAMPAVEPGCLIEYRWKEIRNDSLAVNLKLPMQRDIPVQTVKYFVKPLDIPDYRMISFPFNCTPTPFQREEFNYPSTQLKNVPAFRVEPDMPPEEQVKAWLLLTYTKQNKIQPDRFWGEWGQDLYTSNKAHFKPNDTIRRVADEITAGEKSGEKKVRKLFDFCRNNIRNIYDDASNLTAEDRKKIKENKNPTDTLTRKTGTGFDIDMLFAALCAASDLEVRLAALPDRSRLFFNKNLTSTYQMPAFNIAVKIEDRWLFCDPAQPYTPFGMLRWQEEGVPALIADPKNPIFVNTPLSPPEKSVRKSVAKMKLNDDGTLEGDVHIEYSGHWSTEQKEFHDDHSPAQREEHLKESIRGSISTAELTDIRVENVEAPDQPFRYAFHLKIPGYAQRTGRRLFLQPSLFRQGKSPRFPVSTRLHPIYFHYPWKEEDRVEIDLPAGYGIESGDSPAPLTAQGVSQYEATIALADGHTLLYNRNFHFGAGGIIYIPAERYSAVKNFFDAVHKSDTHTITLKQISAENPAH